MSEHTKGKWEVSKFNEREIWVGANKHIATCYRWGDESIANARRICQCVNSHDDLLVALEEGQNRIKFLLNKIINAELFPEVTILTRIEIDKTESCIDFIKQAIAKAKR